MYVCMNIYINSLKAQFLQQSSYLVKKINKLHIEEEMSKKFKLSKQNADLRTTVVQNRYFEC